jgi:hypothetical protein
MSNKMKRNNEQPTDILFWFRDGLLGSCDASVTADTTLSVGRTNSKRAMGFVVTRGKTQIDFVLDRDQVGELAAYLKQWTGKALLAPPGRRKRRSMNLAAMNLPKRRLFNALENAAMKAHPGWSKMDADGDIEVEDGAPEGKALVRWFKKTFPRRAARIEKAFTKQLWEGY